jgi:poly(hydroxyalkanoate) depolymerase family esterase
MQRPWLLGVLLFGAAGACGVSSDRHTFASSSGTGDGARPGDDPADDSAGDPTSDAATAHSDTGAPKVDASGPHGSMSQIQGFGSNPGKLDMFLWAPNPLPAKDIPVIVVLHGCLHSVAAYEQDVGWGPVADEKGFLVIYPQITANNGCFGWNDPEQARRDKGQALSIKQMVDYVKSKYSVKGAYVTGASSGGAMTSIMLATYPDVFDAGAVMSGVPFACSNTIASMTTCMLANPAYGAHEWATQIQSAAPVPAHYPRVAVWHGSADTATHPINAAEVVSGWNEVHGLAQKPSSTWTIGPATYSQFKDGSGVVQVEEWMIAGMGHGVALDPKNGCGNPSKYMLDVGLCSTRLAVDFFFGTPGGNLNTGAGSPWQCKEYYANNIDHGAARRATLCPPASLEACAIGSGDDMGLAAITEMSWLKETFLGYFTPGRCP